MRKFNILNTRKKQLLAYSIGLITLIAFVVWDFRQSNAVEKTDMKSQGWAQLETSEQSSGWAESERSSSKGDPSIISKVTEGYRRLKPPVLPMISEERQPIFERSEPVHDVAPELPQPPLIKFEYTAVEEDEVVEDVPAMKLPVGTMLYARLLKPVDSRLPTADQPVYAELTRALILNFKTILPADTKLVGQLKSMRQGRASFGMQWRIVIDGEDQYTLAGLLQERDYDPSKGIYGAFDGVTGLRMKPVDIDYEPKVHKLERLLEDVVRPLAIQKSQSEILKELELPTLDNPWDIDGFEDDEEQDGEAYYLPAGTEFYIQIFSQ